MSTVSQRIGRIPVLGYLLKVVHDVLALPIIRRQLHEAFLTLEQRCGEIDARRASEIARLEAGFSTRYGASHEHLAQVLAHVSRLSSTVHDLRDLPAGLRSVRQSQLWLDARVAGLERNLGEVSEKLHERSQDDSRLRQQWDSVESSIDELVRDLASLRQEFVTVASGLRGRLGRLENAPDKHQEMSEEIRKLRESLAALAPKATSAASNQDLIRLGDRFTQFADHAEHFLQSIRSELLVEVDSRLRKIRQPADAGFVPRVINPGKLLQFPDGLRLNLCSGTIALKEYLNVDQRELRDVDVLAEVGNLPFGPESATELFASHVLEHFKEAELKATLLPYWRRILKP